MSSFHETGQNASATTSAAAAATTVLTINALYNKSKVFNSTKEEAIVEKSNGEKMYGRIINIFDVVGAITDDVITFTDFKIQLKINRNYK